MIHETAPPSPRRGWRVFAARLAREIDRQLAHGRAPCCPRCGDMLEAQPRSRLARHVPLGARAWDLDCRDCRRFWMVVQHTPRSIRLLRMRRFVAAVRAAGSRQPQSSDAALPTGNTAPGIAVPATA